MLMSAVGRLTMVGLESGSPKLFWNGLELTQVIDFMAHRMDPDPASVKLKVQNTSDFDAQYDEMTAMGIVIKKKAV